MYLVLSDQQVELLFFYLFIRLKILHKLGIRQSVVVFDQLGVTGAGLLSLIPALFY